MFSLVNTICVRCTRECLCIVINVCQNVARGFHLLPVLVMIALLCWCEHWATPSEVRQGFNVLSTVLHDFRRACLFVLLIVICV